VFGFRRALPPFPAAFRFGVGTADHQCEAYVPGVDDIWDLWERRPGLTPRGRAADFWNRYAEDVQKASALGCRVFRFSIAWSRVEPSPGNYDRDAFEHYRQVIRAIQEAQMDPLVTLLHFVWPPHLEARGGLIGNDFPVIFADYATEVARQLGPEVKDWITINEPTQLIYGYIKPWWEADYRVPPGLPEGATLDEQVDAVGRLIRNLFLAHIAAREAIHAVIPDARVGTNPVLLGFPPWLQRFLNWSATRLQSPGDLARHVRRLVVRPLPQRGTVDVVAATFSKTPQRAGRVAFSTDYYVAGQRLCVLAASSVNTASDLVGRTVVVVIHSTAEQGASVLLPGVRTESVGDYRAALNALDEGRTDALLADDAILSGLLNQHPGRYRLVGDRLTNERYAVGVPHGDPQLLQIVDLAVRRFRESGAIPAAEALAAPRSLADPVTNPLARAAASRLSTPATPLPRAPTGTLLRRVQERGYLIAGIRTDVPGFGYRDPETGTLSGIEIDLAREIARQIFGDSDRVRFQPTTTGSRLDLLCSPIQRLLDPLLKTISVFSVVVSSNWWHLGMAGKLSKALCPPQCIGQQDFVGFDYYWGISSLRIDRIRHLLEAAGRHFDQAPVWPGALYHMLRFHADLFPGKPILIVENGCVEVADRVSRASYLRRHLGEVQRAIGKGMNVEGYVCWSITSNREWGLPFDKASDFGLYHVELDRDPSLARVPTDAARVFHEIIEKRRG
jgi:beta-glucosidase/6-phospho-beta-glucosidase/beta-galactosidase/ABC-type amino acid transport substrate-binding protein